METMSWGAELWDQFDSLEKHTQWGIEFLDRYTKFIKERCEIEVNYAKQIRNLSKKYQPKKSLREEEESKYTSCRAFLATLNELTDYAGQHEVIAENLTAKIVSELGRYIQDLKAERKSHFHDGRKAQQHMENAWKQLESSKRRFERDCREADRARQHFEKMDADINVTKADVEKARLQAQMRAQIAEDSKSEYSSCLENFNQEQNQHYHTLLPLIFQRIQEMEERRVEQVGVCMKTFAEVERQVLPIVGTCLDEMSRAAESIQPKADSQQVVECYKSGFEPPGDVEFEDYGLKRTASDSNLSHTRSRSKSKLWPFIKRNRSPPPPPSSPPSPDLPNGPHSPKPQREPLSHRLSELISSKPRMHCSSKPRMHCLRSLKRGQSSSDNYFDKELMKRTLGKPTYAFEARQYVLSLKLGSGSEDLSHLPPEQRRKRLQAKIQDIGRHLQKELDEKEALTKMKDVYQKSPQMGDPSSVEPRLAEICENIDRLRLEAQKFEGWLAEEEGRLPVKSDPPRKQSGPYGTKNSSSCGQDRESPDGSYTEDQNLEMQQRSQSNEMADKFEDEEPLPAISTCKVLYPFEGQTEGTMSVSEGELLHMIEEDKGDGWTRVRRNDEEEGYVPTSYIQVFLDNSGQDS
ncbi:formin-binding protein 1-like isoform X4 [Anguilla anguilla]|uniref:formin-binding protein 1-like isoform X4 n=1 Tax=Anguilla anguilla TaxID=7936 RepID=UPI0015A8B935|nr:formin-binding protein 1-like isoform X4 [Anguilla anguilla]